MSLDISILIPFLSFATVCLVLLSDYRRSFSVVGLGLLIGYLVIESLWDWGSLKEVSESFMNSSPESLSVLISFVALILMTFRKRRLDLTVNIFIILPLMFGLVLTRDLFMFTVLSCLLLSLCYYQIIKDISGVLLSVIRKTAYLEIFLIVAFGFMGLFSKGLDELGLPVNLTLFTSCFFAFIYVLLQGPLNIKLFSDGLTANRILTLSIPKSIICLQLIFVGHGLLDELSISYQKGLTDFIYYILFIVLGSFTFLSFFQNSRWGYSRTYTLSVFSILSSLIIFGIPLDNRLLLIIILLDTVISYCALSDQKNGPSTGLAFTLQSTLLPLSIVFFSKLFLLRYIILESNYHPFSYLVLFNQVCLSIAAIKICSKIEIGKINLSARHAVYLTCVIISACLMVILP